MIMLFLNRFIVVVWLRIMCGCVETCVAFLNSNLKREFLPDENTTCIFWACSFDFPNRQKVVSFIFLRTTPKVFNVHELDLLIFILSRNRSFAEGV